MKQSRTVGVPAAAPARPQPPAPVSLAVRLMYAGAAVTAVSVIVSLFSVSAFRTALQQAHPNFTASQIHTLVDAAVLFDVITDVVYVAAWIAMAFANRAGRGWARIAGTVLFVFYTLSVAVSFAGSSGGSALLAAGISLLLWLIGLATVVLLWRPAASEFFRASTAR